MHKFRKYKFLKIINYSFLNLKYYNEKFLINILIKILESNDVKNPLLKDKNKFIKLFVFH